MGKPHEVYGRTGEKRMSIKFFSRIKKIEPRKRVLRAWKDGEEIRTKEEDMGWFMLLEGSWESLYVGETQPEEFNIGDEVEVLIQRKS
jgi:hypothetical protein